MIFLFTEMLIDVTYSDAEKKHNVNVLKSLLHLNFKACHAAVYLIR